MSAKPQRPKRKKSKTSSRSAYAASTLSVATQNLINMVAVSAVSGTVCSGFWPPSIFDSTAISAACAAGTTKIALAAR